MKKLLPFLVVGILVLTGLCASADPFYNNSTIIKWKQNTVTNTLKDDLLDQSQLDMDWFGPIGSFPLAGGVNYIVAQTFKPTKSILTRVELMIGKNSTTTYDYTVAIRNTLNGSDLAAVSLPAEQITTENFSWIEFNFSDIAVTPGNTYYIISYTVNATDNWYAWGMKIGDAYPNGTVYYTINDGATWDEEPNGDMTFKTYGKENIPPSNPLIDGPIKGLPFISYTFTFTSTDPDGDDVSYYIDWGDNKTTNWTTYQPSGSPGYTESHSWYGFSKYTIKVKAKDTYGAESDWTELSFSTPRIRAINNILYQFLGRFPNVIQILRHLKIR